MLPKAGIEMMSAGVRRVVPEITICATLVAAGSLTARAPAMVAYGEIALMPVQPWQLTHAPSNTRLPTMSAVSRPCLGNGGAGGAIVAGCDDASGGMLCR